MTAKRTGLATICTPTTAAVRPCSPRSTRLWIFSPTMIASSTTTPITMRKAKSDRKFSVTPINGNSMKAPAKAVAMPMVTQNATIGRRKRIRMISTSPRPRSAELPITVSWELNWSAPSHHSDRDTVSGSCVRFAVDIGGQLARDVDDIGIARRHQRDEHHGLAIEGRGKVAVFQPVRDGGDIAHADHAASGGLAHDDVAELVRGVGQMTRGDTYLTQIGGAPSRPNG